jgi:cellulose synthase/poly-beta-1,6-N-acetylglucosamine synthase-like glycosyltransferase
MGELFIIIVPDVFVLFFAYTMVLSVKFYKKIYRRFYTSRYQQGYTPYISLFVPCKGRDEYLEHNIQNFLTNHYHNTKVFFIVESLNDPAFPLLKKYVQDATDAYVVVAGLSKTCGQKNHNLLQGIKASEERDEVYVFLDVHTTITAQQLHDLVLPLSNPSVTASVGFRWNILQQNTLGEKLHAFMIALQWAAMNCFWVHTVWGGATAIKRESFEKMGVREYWSKTVVDDMTLQQMLMKQRRKAVFVPTCVKETDYTITGVPDAIAWFERQCLYVKYYLRPFWIGMLGVLLYVSANIIGLPIMLAYAALYPSKKIVLFTGMKGAFVGLTMLYCRLIKRPSNDNSSPSSWFWLAPIYLLLSCWACLLGGFIRVLRWKGIAYHLDYHGTVKKIVRD